MRNYWAKVIFCEFIRHYRKLDDATIVADVRQSMDDLEALLPSGNSFGAKMVKWSNERIEFNRETRGKKGGRPRKNVEALVKPTLPGTSSGNGEALNDEGATAPAGKHFEEARTPSAATTPVPASAHGNAAEGGLLTPWYGPEAGETLDNGRRLPARTRTDAHAREDWDASATVRAQTFEKRPGKSATPFEKSVTCGGSERGAGGTAIDAVRRSPGAKKTEPKLPHGSAGNVLLTATEARRLADEFGDVGQLVEEMSDYLLLHPNKYRSHYAALRNWCRRRRQEGRNPDGTRMTQGDRLARYFAEREREIIHGHNQDQ